MGEDVLGLWSLVKGLKITGTYFFSKQVTVHYPRTQVDNLETFRGPIELVPNPEDPGRPLCIACMTCASTCPTGAISVIKKKAPKPREEASDENTTPHKAPKGPAKFTYDYTLCCQCGLCAENCPKGAIQFSGNPFSASIDKKEFEFDLLEIFENRQP
jgi:NADH-quinone oxidoreductase subunit I